ncbi:MAG: hypothetical protein AAB368_05890, partial [bacterium]
LALAAFARRRRRGRVERRDLAGMALVGIAVLVATAQAVVPWSAWWNWDAWAIWDLKARAWFEAGGWPAGYLGNPDYGFSHRDYPPLLPWLQAWFAVCAGGLDGLRLRLLSPVFLAGLAVLLARLLGEAGAARGRWLLAGAFVLTPKVIEHGANGYADLPVACAATGALLAALRARRGGPAWPVAAWGGAAALLKEEGLVWGAACTLVAAWPSGTGGRRWGRLLGTAALFALLAAPWRVAAFSLGLRSIDRAFDVGTPRRALVAAPTVVKAFLQETVGPGVTAQRLADGPAAGIPEFAAHLRTGWLLFWPAALLRIALGWRRLGGSPAREIGLVLAAFAAAVLLAYGATVHDLAWHLETSLDRLMLQAAPAVWALACVL